MSAELATIQACRETLAKISPRRPKGTVIHGILSYSVNRKGIIMATVFDVAAYIIEKQTHVTSVKLQKLVYYSQAWSLVWDDEPLFDEEVQAWANGPVVYELFDYYRGNFGISQKPKYGDSNRVSDAGKDTINVVLTTYGHLSASQLSFLTHSEAPWRDARGNLADTERSQAVIGLAAMQTFYSTLEFASDSINVKEVDWPAMVKVASDFEDASKEG